MNRYIRPHNADLSIPASLPQALRAFRAAGKRLLFVTNNSSKSRAQYVDKFRGLGLDVAAEEVRRQGGREHGIERESRLVEGRLKGAGTGGGGGGGGAVEGLATVLSRSP